MALSAGATIGKKALLAKYRVPVKQGLFSMEKVVPGMEKGVPNTRVPKGSQKPER